MSRHDHEDSRLRGERRREAIEALREELKGDTAQLMKSAERYLQRGVVDPKFRDLVRHAVQSYLDTGTVSPNRLHAVAGVVAVIEIDDEE